MLGCGGWSGLRPCDRSNTRSFALPVAWLELATGLLLVVVGAAAWAQAEPGMAWSVLPAAATVYAVMAVILALCWKTPARSLGAANRVTLFRGTLVALAAGALSSPQALAAQVWVFAGLAATALVMDGADGWIARRSGGASAFGARFDMELDAFFILVLCSALFVLGRAGVWVLAIAAMRYAFLGSMRVWPWLGAPLPESFRRKLVCVWQVATLLVCLPPWMSAGLARGLLALALALLAWSFARDIRWLRRHRLRSGALAKPLSAP